jgi:hypothetical protein
MSGKNTAATLEDTNIPEIVPTKGDQIKAASVSS